MSNDKNLYYLHELPDYQVDSDYCDVRGWDVKDGGNRIIGKVDNLLVNKKDERVVYLDVEINKELLDGWHKSFVAPADQGIHEFLNKDGENHLIIPIGMASLDEENKLVLTQIDDNTFKKTSRFSKGSDINRDYEINIIQHYIPGSKIMSDNNQINDSFYKGREFENTFQRRQHTIK